MGSLQGLNRRAGITCIGGLVRVHDEAGHLTRRGVNVRNHGWKRGPLIGALHRRFELLGDEIVDVFGRQEAGTIIGGVGGRRKHQSGEREHSDEAASGSVHGVTFSLSRVVAVLETNKPLVPGPSPAHVVPALGTTWPATAPIAMQDSGHESRPSDKDQTHPDHKRTDSGKPFNHDGIGASRIPIPSFRLQGHIVRMLFAILTIDAPVNQGFRNRPVKLRLDKHQGGLRFSKGT